MAKRYLIGVGNATMTDDGIGPRVAEAATGRARDLGVETAISGHDAVGLLAYFEEATERILFVDCVRMGKRPGDWASFSPDHVDSGRKLDRLTTHEGDLLRIVEMAKQLGLPIPSIVVLGIEPERIEPGLELSPTLRTRFDEYVDAAVAELSV